MRCYYRPLRAGRSVVSGEAADRARHCELIRYAVVQRYDLWWVKIT